MIPPRIVFLVGGIGALATAILTGIILPVFNEYIGMPLSWLRGLAVLAVCLNIYSFSCHLLLRTPSPLFLAVIMWANLIYCTLTALIIFRHRDDIRPFGIAYFAVEILVILILVAFEYQTFKSMRRTMR